MSDIQTIDTGYTNRDGFAAAYLMREGDRAAFIETNTNRAVPRLLSALEAEELRPEAVEYVIVTHVHLDHAGGASALMDACPNATLLAHPRAAPHLIDPQKLVKSAQAVYGADEFREMYGEIRPVPAERVRIMQDNETLAFGQRTLTFLHTRGHANHHFCVLDSASGIFTGDSFGLVYPALQSHGLFAFPSTSPTDFDAAEAKASLDRILATDAGRAFLTHFGEQRDLNAIADQLHHQLDVYGALADEAFGSDLESDAIGELCQKRVRALFDKLLSEHGLGGDPAARALLETDIDLNAQGVAFSVQKRRHKAQQRG